MKALVLVRLVPVLLAGLAPGCAIVSVGSEGDPPRVQSDGLVDGHVAFGIREEDDLIEINLFDGRSPGAIGEISLWRLFRAEVGLAGASLGLGPIDLGLGVVFYDPRVPHMQRADDEYDHDHIEQVEVHEHVHESD